MTAKQLIEQTVKHAVSELKAGGNDTGKQIEQLSKNGTNTVYVPKNETKCF